jgi:hypothetical protein
MRLTISVSLVILMATAGLIFKFWCAGPWCCQKGCIIEWWLQISAVVKGKVFPQDQLGDILMLHLIGNMMDVK